MARPERFELEPLCGRERGAAERDAAGEILSRTAAKDIRPNKNFLKMARPERFELPTYCSGGNRSIQLSYGRATGG